MRSLLLLVPLLAGCGGAPPGPRDPDEYTGCATDEHWRTFDDQEPLATVSDALAPNFTAPAANAIVPSAMLLKMTWNQDPNDPGMPTGDVAYTNGPGCTMCCPEFNLGALMSAHLPAISGNVYDLQFLIGGQVIHRVITTLQEWAPPAAIWAQWKGQAITVKIWRLDLLHNDVKVGPYAPSMAFPFRVGT